MERRVDIAVSASLSTENCLSNWTLDRLVSRQQTIDQCRCDSDPYIRVAIISIDGLTDRYLFWIVGESQRLHGGDECRATSMLGILFQSFEID